MVRLIPSWANSTGECPYSFSKAHLAPRLSANHHSASRALTTNQPSVTGTSHEPQSLSCDSSAMDGSAERAFEGGSLGRRAVGREHQLDGPVQQRPQALDDLVAAHAGAQPAVDLESLSEVGERVAGDDCAVALDPEHEVVL